MPQSIKHTAQAVSTPITLHSATLRLVKVESGIKGLLPTSWAPPIYSVSLLTKLRCALAGNGLLHLAAVRSFLARICRMQKPTKMMKNSEKTHQGLYNVGFIGDENNGPSGPYKVRMGPHYLRTAQNPRGPILTKNGCRRVAAILSIVETCRRLTLPTRDYLIYRQSCRAWPTSRSLAWPNSRPVLGRPPELAHDLL